MSGSRFVWLIVLFPLCAWGQSVDRFQTLLMTAPSRQHGQATLKMHQFISKLQAKRTNAKSDETFLYYLFREAHKTLLSRYKAYSQFPEIFDSGNYDCLSATSLFSVMLDAFGFKYKIIETNYHIFLIVETDHQEILIESTDRGNGFVTNDQLIKERLNRYQENRMQMSSSPGKYLYQYDLDLYQEVTPQQLSGLLYFNQAVVAFNENDLPTCAQKLKKAIRIYNSPRIAEFAVILVNKIADSELGDEEKKLLITPFASIIKVKAAIVASR